MPPFIYGSTSNYRYSVHKCGKKNDKSISSNIQWYMNNRRYHKQMCLQKYHMVKHSNSNGTISFYAETQEQWRQRTALLLILILHHAPSVNFPYIAYNLLLPNILNKVKCKMAMFLGVGGMHNLLQVMDHQQYLKPRTSKVLLASSCKCKMKMPLGGRRNAKFRVPKYQYTWLCIL